MTFEFIKDMYGASYADTISGVMEYPRHAEDFDPFSGMFNVTPTNADWISRPTATAA